MPDYDFYNLSPIDFEILVRDLLQEELGVRLESFKSGKDQGIDCRYCPSKDNNLIVQAKRYIDTDYKTFFRYLKNDELPKVQRLHPSRYILATSLGLTPFQKDELFNLHKPYIINVGDIYGCDDINNLLSRHPKIERQHFKLWITSTNILEQLLHSKIHNASRDELEKIQTHAKYYVKNESYGKALKTLDDHNFCIIAGTPGIGKTILAEMLALHYINLGYEIVKVTEDISEATCMDYINQKRLFYYDDFLGQTSLSEKLNKNEDQRLLDFIQALRRSKISKLILTTREYILNQARMSYEKLSTARLNVQTFIIDLSFYTRKIRSQILYNHLYFSELSDDFKLKILDSDGYIKVIDHLNYNPRIVQFMTDPQRITGLMPTEYWTIFLRNLDNPRDIWRHAFEEQLSHASRHLLLVLFTLPQEVFLEDIEKAFESFHKKQAQEHSFTTSSSDFDRALKELESSFIRSSKSRKRIIIQFINPSVKDFLANFIVDKDKLFSSLIDNCVFHEQLTWLWKFYKNNMERFGHFLRAEDVIIKIVRLIGITMLGLSCQIVNYKDTLGYYKDVLNTSYEGNALLSIDILSTVANNVTINTFNQVLEKITERIQNNSANKEDLIEFLRTAKTEDISSVKSNELFLHKVKKYLMTNLIYLNEYRAISDFHELFDILFDEDEKSVIRSSFVAFAAQLDIDESNPDILRSDATELESIGNGLCVDVSDDVVRLESYADEIEASVYEEEDRDYEGYGNEPDFYSDNDIRSMFATLK